MISGVGALALALIVGVVIAVAGGAGSGRQTGRGCVYAVFPGPVGAEEIYRCGAAARTLCSAVRSAPGYSREARSTIAGQCRKAGLPLI